MVVVVVVPFLIMGQRFMQLTELAAVFVVEIPDQWTNKKNHRDDEDTRKLEKIDEEDPHVIPRPIIKESRISDFLRNVLDILEKLVWIMGKIEKQHGD